MPLEVTVSEFCSILCDVPQCHYIASTKGCTVCTKQEQPAEQLQQEVEGVLAAAEQLLAGQHGPIAADLLAPAQHAAEDLVHGKRVAILQLIAKPCYGSVQILQTVRFGRERVDTLQR